MHPSGVPRGNAGHSPLRETEVVERDDEEDGEREATELSPIRNNGPSSNSNVRPKDTRSWLHRFWRNNVSMSVPHDDCRDHLGKVHPCKCSCICACGPTVHADYC